MEFREIAPEDGEDGLWRYGVGDEDYACVVGEGRG